MADNSVLTRELQSVEEFLHASASLRQVADDGRGRALVDFADAFVQATANFGLCELRVRQAERLDALGRQEQIGLLRDRSAVANTKGLRSLSNAREALNNFRQELAGYPDRADVGAAIDRVREEVPNALADLEVKAPDIEKINAALDEGFEVARAGDPGQVADYLEERVRRLDRVRRQEDRGTVENIPVWKIVAIAVAVGIWIWAFFRCTWWGSCSYAEGLAYFIIFWLAALVSRFC
jgi:hypothetical protein